MNRKKLIMVLVMDINNRMNICSGLSIGNIWNIYIYSVSFIIISRINSISDVILMLLILGIIWRNGLSRGEVVLMINWEIGL